MKKTKIQKPAGAKSPLTKEHKEVLYQQFKARLEKELIPLMSDVSIVAYYKHINDEAIPSYDGVTTNTGINLMRHWSRTRFSKEFKAALAKREAERNLKLKDSLKINLDIVSKLLNKGGLK